MRNKLIKIINIKNPLKSIFNKWKNNKDLDKIQIENINSSLSKKKITLKKDTNLPIQEEPKKEIDNISHKERKSNEKNKIAQKIIELTSKITNKNNKNILKKYYNKWITKQHFTNEYINDDMSIKTSINKQEDINNNMNKDFYKPKEENKIEIASKLDIINTKIIPIKKSETTSININSIEKKSLGNESKIVRPIEIKIDEIPNNENRSIFEKKPKIIEVSSVEEILKNKLIKIINICNPLQKFFKRWKSIKNKEKVELNKDIIITKKKMIITKFDIEKEDNKEPLIKEEKNIDDKTDTKGVNNTIEKESEINIEGKIIGDNINDIKANEEIDIDKTEGSKTYKIQKKRFVENVHKSIKFKNIIVKILEKNFWIKGCFNYWKNQTNIYDNKGKEYDTIITSTTKVHHKTHIPKRKHYPIKSDFQIENIEKEKQKNLTISKPKTIDIFLNKMNEKRKRKLLIKYIIKINEKNEEILKKYLNIWKNDNENNCIHEENEDLNIIKTKNKKTITTIKTNKNIEYKETQEEKDIDSIKSDKARKDSSSNLYIKHRPHALNYVYSTKNEGNKKNKNYNQYETKNETTTPKLNKNEKISLITEKTRIKVKYIKEETKKFNLPNPKKEINKEFIIIIPPKERKDEYDTIDLNLPTIPIPKIPQKKTQKVEINTNTRYTHNQSRRNHKKFSEMLSPVYRSNKRTIDLESSENSSNNNDTITVRKKLKFEKNTSTIDNEEINTISLKNDPSIETREFGYRTYTFIPHKKIIKGGIKGREIIKKDIRNRLKEKDQDLGNNTNDNNLNTRINTRRKYERKLFNIEKKQTEIKSKTFVIETKVKQFYLDKQCKKEYNKDYNDYILCEEIVYKSYNAIPEKILNISTIRKPTKKRGKILKTIENFEQIENYEEVTEERESIFVQKVIRYKERERKYGHLFKSPIKSPMTPYKNEIVISSLSPFSRTTTNFFKEKERRLNLFSPRKLYKERTEKREKEILIERKEQREKEILIERKEKEKLVYEKDIKERQIIEKKDKYIEKKEENKENNDSVMSPRIPKIRTNILSPRIINDVNFNVKKVMINIPKCPKSETIDYLKDINRPSLKNEIIDNIDSMPIKETIGWAKLPDKRFYPKIYKSSKITQNLVNFHMQFLRDVPHHTFNNVAPKKLYEIINDTNKKLALMKIYYIYAHYKYDKYLIKKIYWNKWLKNINISTGNNNQFIHLTNIYGHCISAEKIVVKEIRCGIHPYSMNYMDCLCLRTRFCLKRILLRHYLLKVIDRRKYYMYLWYKNAFGRIRQIYL